MSDAVPTSKPRVLVVDDEDAVRRALERALELEGYAVEQASDGQEALLSIAESVPDVVVLDVLMPNLDGLETCRRLRTLEISVPVLMLTARDAVSDRVEGLDAGADDYLVKPFALAELLARVRALLRRSENGVDAALLTMGDLTVDLGTREVARAGRSIELTRTEFNLLELFMRNPRQVLTRSQIFERVWGYDFGATSNSLDVY
ncbi:MAG: response regulator transcription factor, partial [Gaiellaceae bacterium]